MCSEEAIDLFFYGEMDARAHAGMRAHLSTCAACRQSLADLQAIEEALGERAVSAPPAGDWSGFMRRLDARLDREGGTRPAAPPTVVPISMLRIAAALALIATGAIGGWTLSRLNPETPAPDASRVVSTAAQPDTAMSGAAETGLERARVVLAGLAQKQQGAEWTLEQRMAATLLPEVTLIRQAAAARGRADLEDILQDVETLLLQASYAKPSDAETLERLRGMIDRRDLLVRLSVAAGAPAAQPAAAGSTD